MRELKSKRPPKRKYTSRATPKQIKAFNIALKNPQKPMYDVMKEAGYSENSIIHPTKNLTSSKTWQQLMEEFIPDSHLAAKHREFLDSSREIRTYVKGELTTEVSETSPQATKALDMAYKLKGRYHDITIDKALIVNVSSPIADKYKAKTVETYQPHEDAPALERKQNNGE